jgi:small-conductance mechanosensitive channel
MAKMSVRKGLILFLVAVLFIVAALTLVNFLEQPLRDYFFGTGVANTKMEQTAASSFDQIVKLLRIVLWMLLVVVIVRALMSAVFAPLFRASTGYDASSIIRNAFSIVIYIIFFVFIFKNQYPDVDLGAVFTTSAIFGVIIGLALQDTLGNLFAGISLQADKPFQVGDVISVPGKGTGVVESVTWRGIKIRTFQNHIILISNTVIGKEAIEVCPKNNLNARLVFFNTLYTDSPAKTVHVVREAVRDADNVSTKIAPVVRIKNLAESGIDWELKYWLVDYAKYNDTDALVRQRIWYAFKRAGINFAFPTRTLHVERGSKMTDKPDDTTLIERLSNVEIFTPLTGDELTRLVSSSELRIFAPGETVIKAGDKGSSMFVINRGRVRVQISENGKPRTVATLNEGDFFGEMALFTGEPRTANVVAAEETEVLEIGHHSMKQLFETNPDLVEVLSAEIAERRTGLKQKEVTTETTEDESEGLFTTIKRFFGMS